MTRLESIGRTALAAVIVLTGTTGTARADTFDSLARLSQVQFDTLVTNLGAATQYKGLTPGEPLGTIGADVGIEVTSTDVDAELFALAASESDDTVEALVVPRLHAHKGLPGGVDIGAFIGAIAGSELTLVGAELRLALLRGGIVSPALGLRVAASRLQGSTELDLDNYSAELVLSKGFLPFTPYIGAGLVRSVGEARDRTRFEQATIDQEKFFVGMNINLGINLAFEADVTGDYTTYSAKAGFRF